MALTVTKAPSYVPQAKRNYYYYYYCYYYYYTLWNYGYFTVEYRLQNMVHLSNISLITNKNLQNTSAGNGNCTVQNVST